MLHNMTQAALSFNTLNISAHMRAASTSVQQFVNELLDYLQLIYSLICFWMHVTRTSLLSSNMVGHDLMPLLMISCSV